MFVMSETDNTNTCNGDQISISLMHTTIEDCQALCGTVSACNGIFLSADRCILFDECTGIVSSHGITMSGQTYEVIGGPNPKRALGSSADPNEWVQLLSGKQTCSNDAIWTDWTANTLTRCIATCNQTQDCRAFFFITDSEITNHCLLFSSCDHYRATMFSGDTYASLSVD